jgi:hypothetical protein
MGANDGLRVVRDQSASITTSFPVGFLITMTGSRSTRAAEIDTGKRKVIYRQINQINQKINQINQIGPGEASMMPLLHGVTNAALRKRVRGLNTVFGWDAKMNPHRFWFDKT